MMKRCFYVLVVAALLGMGTATAYAATVFSDDFTGGASSYWSNSTVADYTNDTAAFTGVGDGARIYLYTNDTDYASVDFVADVDLNNSVNRYIFFGLGQGEPDETFYYEPTTGFQTHLRYNEVSRPLTDVVVNGAETSVGAHDYGSNMHVKLFWEAATSTATYCIDSNMDGGYEYISSFVNTDLSGTGVISRLYIGGADGVYADNFSVSFDIPEIPEVQSRVIERMVLDPYSGRYYKVVKDVMTFDDAKTYAESQTYNGVQGRLVEINDGLENAFVRGCGQGNNVWIGLTDADAYGTTEGNWVWTGPNGETKSLTETGYSNWNAGEPNDWDQNEDAIELDTGGGWNDNNVAVSRCSVIEFGQEQEVAKGFFHRRVSGPITNAYNDTDAIKVINGVTSTSAEVTSQTATYNFVDVKGESGGNAFGGTSAFPGDDLQNAEDDFVVKSYVTLDIEEAGTYTFGGVHDDLLMLSIDRGGQEAVTAMVTDWNIATSSAGTGTVTATFDAPGTYNLYCLFGEDGGGANAELAMAKGNYDTSSAATESEFRTTYSMFTANAALIGDTLNGGVATKNLRQIHTQGGFTTNGTIATDTVNFASDGQGSGSFGNNTTMTSGTAMNVTGQLVVPEDSAGWWTLGVTQSLEGTLTIMKDGQVVAFSQANGNNNAAAVNGSGTMTWNAPSAGVYDHALGAVNLPAGTYDIVLNYNPNNQVASLPKLNVPNGFDVINAIPLAAVSEIWGAVDLMLDVRDNQAVNTLADSYVTQNYPTINFDEEAADVAHFGNDNYFPSFPSGQVASGYEGTYGAYVSAEIEVTAENAGYWSFCINSDDGFLMQIYDENVTSALSFNQFANVTDDSDSTMFIYDTGRGVSDSFATINLAEGTYQLMMVYWDGGGGGSLELSAAKGEYLEFDDSAFTLLGDSFAEQLELFAAAGVHSEFDFSFDLLGSAFDFEDQSAFYETEKIAGDANGDGKVDGSDVTILAGNWQKGVNDGQTASWEEGDFNGDGKVDGSDVTILAGNWQYGVEAASASVPEPTMLIILLSSITTLLVIRRRK